MSPETLFDLRNRLRWGRVPSLLDELPRYLTGYTLPSFGSGYVQPEKDADDIPTPSPLDASLGDADQGCWSTTNEPRIRVFANASEKPRREDGVAPSPHAKEDLRTRGEKSSCNCRSGCWVCASKVSPVAERGRQFDAVVDNRDLKCWPLNS